MGPEYSFPNIQKTTINITPAQSIFVYDPLSFHLRTYLLPFRNLWLCDLAVKYKKKLFIPGDSREFIDLQRELFRSFVWILITSASRVLTFTHFVSYLG
jgi:hypothetical protein